MTDAWRTAPGLHGSLPRPDRPLLVTMLTGWIDASGAAAAAMDLLATLTGAETVVEFDEDTFIDYRARRPILHVRDGVNTGLEWDAPRLRAGRDSAGRDVLLLCGPEPDAAWRRFAAEVSGLAVRLGVRRMIALGAYPIAVPHTRAVRLSCTTPDADLANSLPFARNSVDVPAGMSAVLEESLAAAGIESIGLWAQVPHYVASMPYPAASLALLRALCDVGGIDVPTGSLAEEASAQKRRIDRLVGQNGEHADMLRQMEEAHDAAEGGLGDSVPNGDQLAAELEQFLREHRSE